MWFDSLYRYPKLKVKLLAPAKLRILPHVEKDWKIKNGWGKKISQICCVHGTVLK